MTVYELSQDQLTQLKRQYYIDFIDENPSYDILADIDSYVSDQDVYDYWSETEFVPEDFAGEDEQGYTEFGWTGMANDINAVIRDLNRIVDRFIDKVRTNPEYADLYDSLAAANNELLMARLQAQDIEWKK